MQKLGLHTCSCQRNCCEAKRDFRRPLVSHQCKSQGYTSFTVSIRSSNQSVGTHASYRTTWQGVSHHTCLAWRAGIPNGAGVLTRLSDAGQLWRAISINSTLWFRVWLICCSKEKESCVSKLILGTNPTKVSYVLNKKCNHLLAMDKCRCISPCGSLPHNGPLGRKRGWYTASHIPSCPMMDLESHTFHRKSSLHEIDSQLLCKTHRGSLVILGDRRRCPCVFQACTLLYFHKWWVDKGPHIRLICMSCQMDSPRPFDIALRED